ncbi:unnamed protein product [Brachionus calyciflorus]|uniref:Calcium-transporting ATPase n=1 Tax=Brachionus calyciflorus TaxID=104777 RepID=A0A813W2W7_9BILA|nr:unnamed protein product [Brachionus calyciflorus]
MFDISSKELSELIKSSELLAKLGGVDGLLLKLKADPKKGLDSTDENDIKSRITYFGCNVIPIRSSDSFFHIMFNTVKDPTLIILIISAIISLSTSFFHKESKMDEEYTIMHKANLEWIEGMAILITVIAIVFVSSFYEWKKEKEFRNLKSKIDSEQKISVLRNGKFENLQVNQLLVGDICHIYYGNLIPADGIIIESSDLQIDESSLTGETCPVKKSLNLPWLFSGTHVMEGHASMLVLAVGLQSQTGLIMSLMGAVDNKKNKKSKVQTSNIQTEINTKEQSVLQAKINRLIKKLGYIGICISILTVVILMAHHVYIKPKLDYDLLSAFFKSLIIGITILVVAVPEGLPLAVTISFAYAIKRMIKENNLVRHLTGCETMGNATTICSDKTGTLTTNRMTVVQCYINGIHYHNQPNSNQIPTQIKTILESAIAINSSYTSKIENTLESEPFQIGNKTECALLGFIENLGLNYNSIRNSNPTNTFLKVYTFNSFRKSMSTCIKHPTLNNAIRIFTKGAPETILSNCKYIMINDTIKELNDLNDIKNEVVDKMANEGLRIICIAYKDLIPDKSNKKMTEIDWENEENLIKTDLTCICICGIEDPVRVEVPAAIEKCKKAGIVVRMLTGDSINTARCIARKCGIIGLDEDFLILDSEEFNEKIKNSKGDVVQQKLDEIWPKLRVLARASPMDKFLLVKHLKLSTLNKNGEVVAVTGDGTNDGPALRKADVGFAMGIQGTDVAKEASDIILTDDNFNSIVKAVLWGRNVYDSIAKFLQFQMTVNSVGVICAFLGSCFIGISPLRAVQMLWINLIMDTLASLALSTEEPSEELLNRKPYGRFKPLISNIMMKNIFGHCIYQILVIFVILFFGPTLFGINNGIPESMDNFEPNQHFTLIFNVFVFMTLFNQINSRKINGERNVFKGSRSHCWFYIIWFIGLIFHVLIIHYASFVLACTRLSLDQWLWCFVFGIGSLLWNQVIATIPTDQKFTRPETKCLYSSTQQHVVSNEFGFDLTKDDLDQFESNSINSNLIVKRI